MQPNGVENSLDKEINALKPKMWKDLTDAEKIARLRETIKHDQWSKDKMWSRIYALEELVKNHIHRDNGEVVQKVRSVGVGSGSVSSNSAKSLSNNPDDVYF